MVSTHGASCLCCRAQTQLGIAPGRGEGSGLEAALAKVTSRYLQQNISALPASLSASQSAKSARKEEFFSLRNQF